MDHNHDEIFSGLRHKIKMIISRYEEQRMLNEGLRTKNKELNNKVMELENQLKTVEQNFDKLKLAKALSSNEDIHDTKLQVSRIVREIDKCIALLNR